MQRSLIRTGLDYGSRHIENIALWKTSHFTIKIIKIIAEFLFKHNYYHTEHINVFSNDNAKKYISSNISNK